MQAEKEGKVPQIDRDIGDKGGTIQRLSRVSPKEEELFADTVFFVDCRLFWGIPNVIYMITCVAEKKVRMMCICVAIGECSA